MKAHTTGFKENLIELGRELRGVITYGNTTLEEEIYSITPHYNADLLKSVMKQLDIELSVDIPLNTIINCQIGIKVNEQYEMLNYGNYVVYKSEKQEDTNTYKLTCYDKMLYSMKKNEKLEIEYPISIKDYLNAVANKIGLSVATTTFYNENMKIPSELYLGQDYTYRDILDEIAQATGSIICLNENDEIQVKYPTKTNDTIDEEFLKDVNVNFAERYGAINTIVLSRSGESDNVYYPSPLPQNPVEIKIVDNQIMNFNNRSDYLQGIYNALNGLYYYINDFTSTGILYYDVGDLYNVKIGENTYQCLMLNDEVNVTTGIEELVHTDLPEKTETDYSKADKTDMRINKTYLIVDKQAQQIKGVIDQIGNRSNKKTTITADIDGLYSKVIDIEDLTRVAEGLTEVTLENCYPGNILELHIYGNNSVFDGLMPSDTLVPEEGLMPRGDSTIVVIDKEGNSKEYNFGDLRVLKQNEETFDEFVLDNNKAYVIRRIDSDGTTLVNEKTEEIGEFEIPLGEDTNTIKIKNYTAKLHVKYAIKSDYTDVFATKVEMNSSITQTAKEINLEVNKKVDERKIISKINQSAEKISIEANKININGVLSANGNFEIDTSGNMKCINGIFSGDIYTENNGKIASASKGIMSTLFVTNGGNINGYTFLGYATDGNQLLRTSPFVGIYIPSNFMPVQAYLIIEQISSTISVEAGSTTCRAQSIKVRKGGTGPSIDLARICK